MKSFYRLSVCAVAYALVACSPEQQKSETVISFGVMMELVAEAAARQSDAEAVIKSATVIGVVCKSSAHEKGVIKGDSVQSIEGKRILGMSLEEYGRLIKPRIAGIRTAFVFRGVDGEYAVTLETKEVKPDLSCGDPVPGRKV